MSFYVIKASGEKELFNIKKFRRSLQKAGASSDLIKEIVKEIEKRQDLRSTKDIYEFALSFLDNVDRPIAARYNLKHALMELGPAGFSFEKFIAEIFRAQGFEIQTDRIIFGKCVEHEIDIAAKKENQHFIIECKFHNRRGLKSDVKVPLYIKARFDDIKQNWEQHNSSKQILDGAWIVTNTTFTSKAIQYGNCVKLNMLDWKRPKGRSLPELIDSLGLHPITALTSLNTRQKKECIKNGFILCRDAHKYKNVLQRLRLNEYQINKLINESELVCSLSEKKEATKDNK